MSKFDHDTDAALLRAQISTYDKPWYKSCEEVLKNKGLRGLRCLDLCCGNGEFSDILRNRFDMEVVCADYVPLHLERARTKGYETIQINLEDDEDVIDNVAANYLKSFDLVVSLATIEHVFNTANLLAFSHEVLKSNGCLLINTPNVAFSGYLFYSLLAGRPFGEGHHIRFWDYRFLRTNLYLFGFNHFEDFRKFYSLPHDPILRACRNRKNIAWLITMCFHSCRVLHHLSFLRGLCSDELTILSRKEEVPIVGFELAQVRKKLISCDDEVRKMLQQRLQTARRRGWLDEHLYLAKLVDEFD
ncbi:MAG: class I SAM-dependent methyltransferase [Desulfobulbaceae bacterium]|nr:class I SAM-dependent methyltransferase [Desulfobulbaceae bacterium]